MRSSRAAGLGLATALLALPAAQAGEDPAPPFAWGSDLERARALAAEEGRPLLVVFR